MSGTSVVNLRRREPWDVYIGRAGKGHDGYFGNPFRLGYEAHTVEECLEKYRAYFLRRVAADAEFRARVLSLRGKRLACFCKPRPCHGDVIVEWLDQQEVA